MSDVSAPAAGPAAAPVPGTEPAATTSAAGPIGLYVHVPFCVSKCAYCDFYSRPLAGGLAAPYVDALLRHAASLGATGLLDDVATLYIGGGTPTVLGSELGRLLDGLRASAHLREDAEVSVEGNPDTLSPAMAVLLADAGVTRVSLGVQSLDDALLRLLGRPHDAAGALRAAALVRDAGLDLALDLICGIPTQTMAGWEETVRGAIATGAAHVSVYPLSIEEGTPMEAAVATGALPLPDADLAAEMMLRAETLLAEAGLRRYEVANYALPGHESRHNSSYWTGVAYLGLGPGAYGMLPAEAYRAALEPAGAPACKPRAARVRFSVPADLDAYAVRPDAIGMLGRVESLSPAEARREDVMLGLRLVVGVPEAQVAAAGLTAVLRSLADDGLVRLVGWRWATTERGWLLGNEVFGRVWNAA